MEDEYVHTLYLVGADPEDAYDNGLFDSQESAQSFANDVPAMFDVKLYTIQAKVYPATIKEIG